MAAELVAARPGQTTHRRRKRGVEVNVELIRRARVDAGLSQEELGDPLLTRQAVHAIEAGRIRPSPRSLAHIAKRLGLPVEAFLGEDRPTLDSRVMELQRLVDAGNYAEV